MDHVATPTSYEPQDSNLPPGTQGGVTVHYSATTSGPSEGEGGAVGKERQPWAGEPCGSFV